MNVEKRDFDKEASAWDTPPRVKLAEDIAAEILKRVELSRRMDVLDFGCGTGLIALQLAPHVRSVTGADTSKGMLEVFQEKITAKGISNNKTLHLDLTDGAALLGPYHLIVSSMTIHHVRDVCALLKTFYQALLSGGRIAIADLDKEYGKFHSNNDGLFHFGFDREELARMFQEAGFTGVSSSTAAEVSKPTADGTERTFSVFLITGSKK